MSWVGLRHFLVIELDVLPRLLLCSQVSLNARSFLARGAGRAHIYMSGFVACFACDRLFLLWLLARLCCLCCWRNLILVWIGLILILA